MDPQGALALGVSAGPRLSQLDPACGLDLRPSLVQPVLKAQPLMRQHCLYSLRGFLLSDRREAKEILQGRFVGAALRQPAEVDFAALRKTVQLCHASERTVLLGAVVSPAWLSISEPEKRELHVCPFCQADNATWHPMVYERPRNPQALTTRHANPGGCGFSMSLGSGSLSWRQSLAQPVLKAQLLHAPALASLQPSGLLA